MPKGSKNNDSKVGRGPKTRAEKKAIERLIKKLEEERRKLEFAKENGVSDAQDSNRIAAIDLELQNYATADDPMDTGPNTTVPNVPEPNTTVPNVAEANETVSALDSGTTTRFIDDLNLAWDVYPYDSVQPSLRNLPKHAIGHITKTSQARYCIRYGSPDARSALFESSLPDGSKYSNNKDVAHGSNRIIERIVQIHKDRKTALPMDILSKAKILLVYWDSKMGVGHDAEVEVLDPDYPERRPHTRCYVRLDPELYAQYNLENKTGYSHETRSTMKRLMEGNDDRQKSITFHNIAVRLENTFEKKWMRMASGRPGPLPELVQEKRVASRRTRSTYVKTEPSANSTFIKPPTSPRQSTPLPGTRYKQAPTGTKPGISLPQQFHMEYLELFGLAENTTYTDLTEKQRLLYPAQFKKWKEVNL